MKAITPRKSAIYRSWEKDDKTTLIVVVTEDGVSLHHIDARYMETESTLLQLSGTEAKEVAERILRVLRGSPAQNPIDLPAPQLFVTRQTDGEPYREGVALALSNGDWQRDFHFNMTNEIAHELALIMHAAMD
ncbi:hypothetical protein [Devosia sp.]|uniref:hypothetical protein n=1 Tax=Devosia sp. TaxID=1871048 RepID=UPI002732CA09|nr:hypothetical protein [Devosia sp.]MDP2780471.1 hypothetical protein [Devosia sp.]